MWTGNEIRNKLQWKKIANCYTMTTISMLHLLLLFGFWLLICPLVHCYHPGSNATSVPEPVTSIDTLGRELDGCTKACSCYNQRSYINNSLKDVVKEKVQKNLPPSLSKMEAFLLWKGCISLYLIVQKKGNVKSFTITTRLRKLILIVVILFFVISFHLT